MAHFNFVISQNAKWGHAGFYIDCHRMTVPENVLLQKSTVDVDVDVAVRVSQRRGRKPSVVRLYRPLATARSAPSAARRAAFPRRK